MRWLRFYALKRGFHPNARGTATTTSNLAMLEFSALDYIKRNFTHDQSYLFMETMLTPVLIPRELITLLTNQSKD